LSDFAAALEATALAQHLKASRWTYPLVNAGHILGLALVIGAIVPMDLRLLRGATGVAWLRRYAAAGFALAAICGVLLFVTQATEYVDNSWFLAKLAVLTLALGNVVAHRDLAMLSASRRRLAAAISLAAWPSVLVLGRMIAFT
jgi:hypothetical protein